MNRILIAAAFLAAGLSPALAMDPSVTGADQDVSGGSVVAASITAAEDGWLVVHRTDSEMKPGPVVGHAAVKAGENKDVTAKLDEAVASGDMLMLMLHNDSTGVKPGEFEYTLGAKEDGPVRVNDKLVMATITAK